MTVLNEFFDLENGVRIPKIGFGTWQIPNGKKAYDSVAYALSAGYRHVDTAHSYGNESSVGQAVRDSGIPRQEIFVTSKLPAEIKSHDRALRSFEQTMDALGLDYLDLYLIHAPWPWNEEGADYREENAAVWKAMEKIHAGGRCRAIGVSNFEVSDLESLARTWAVKPHVNQIPVFVGNVPEDLMRHCRQNGILVEGYSPLATGAILGNEAIERLARAYGRSLPQLCIRYVLQKGALPLPKSTHQEYILENAGIDFEISTDDMEFLDQLTDTAKGW